VVVEYKEYYAALKTDITKVTSTGLKLTLELLLIVWLQFFIQWNYKPISNFHLRSSWQASSVIKMSHQVTLSTTALCCYMTSNQQRPDESWLPAVLPCKA